MVKPADVIVAYKEGEIRKLYRKRSGEERLGDTVVPSGDNWESCLHNPAVRFVIVGVPEDIGVRANFGRAGASSAFKPAMTAFLNQHSNHFFSGRDILVLGEVRTADLMDKAGECDTRSSRGIRMLRDLVNELDQRMQYVIQAIKKAGKLPVVIGGGHNNAFGNIAGSAAALGRPVNTISCDPHLDFRDPSEGRHSGNGFSTAYAKGLLDRYAVFAMHEQHNNAHALSAFMKEPHRLYYEAFEAIFVREEISFEEALSRCIGFVKGQSCGVEIDMDAIINVPSSARTSSGITAVQARRFLTRCAMELPCAWLHVAEGAPVLSHLKADIKTGKLIAYLMTDFMKGARARLYADSGASSEQLQEGNQ